MTDNFDKQEFYELMQNYRHTPITNIEEVSLAFEEVKSFIREETEKEATDFALWILNLKQNKGKDINELYEEFKKS